MKGGRFILSNATVGIGWSPALVSRMRRCLRRVSKPLGIGLNRVHRFVGSLMASVEYSQELWKLASVYLPGSATTEADPFRKVWREGLEVAIKIKGSQGQPRIEWVKQEHPYTAMSPKSEVHANHNEALNSVLRRKASAYRRRQNHYAKKVEGLQRALNVQRLSHNWCRPHWSHRYKRTPAMVMGFIKRPVEIARDIHGQRF